MAVERGSQRMTDGQACEHRSTLDIVREVVAERHGVPVDEITPETHFYEDFDDSLDLVEILMSCEERFDIDLPDSELARIQTVEDLVGRIAFARAAAILKRGRDGGTAQDRK
jgi:acyl carrier protein